VMEVYNSIIDKKWLFSSELQSICMPV
jgi:hypothetical protein